MAFIAVCPKFLDLFLTVFISCYLEFSLKEEVLGALYVCSLRRVKVLVTGAADSLTPNCLPD